MNERPGETKQQCYLHLSGVAMSQNYKVTKKNRHIARRFHYVKQGVKTKDHEVEWIPNDNQLADEMTKTQEAHKSLPNKKRVASVWMRLLALGSIVCLL